MTGDRIN